MTTAGLGEVTCCLATGLDAALEQVARLLDLPEARAGAWRRATADVAALQPVPVHGDFNEGQTLSAAPASAASASILFLQHARSNT